jgi:aspartate racemase
MRTIGLLGGMSWQSTIPYYRIINEIVSQRLGGSHSARVALHSVDFHEIEMMQRANAWNEVGHKLGAAARALRAGGAGLIVLCTHTMHKISSMIEAQAGVPVLHVVDVVAEAIVERGLKKIGLLGTCFTMEQDFYYGRLRHGYNLDVVIPPDEDRILMHRIVYEELCQGKLSDVSRRHCRRIMNRMVEQGVQAIVPGCTELCTLIGDAEIAVPIFDTTAVHARRAVEWALDGSDRSPRVTRM